MSYFINPFKLFFHRDDHLFKLHRAERIYNFYNLFFLLLFLTTLTYIATSWIGLGTDPLSANATEYTRIEYELRKVWFLLGRVIYAVLFALFLLLVTPFFFWLFNTVSYKKLIIIQMNVLLVMLVERLTWIPFMVYAGLDWYVSPFSFGVLASYFTELDWVIYFFGACSIFQLWIIWYQVKCVTYLTSTKRGWVIFQVIIWHIILWSGASLLAHYDSFLISIL
ncbi:hypothetical protein [Thalassobacillus hwangdonensis]|uniref:Yip1 domain-containing protein n=1 Tax=Thalassobacillus hwangdonensis TaxID=546108 RepID=A0ABW3L403_9BACI